MKKIVALVLTALTAVTLTACNNGGGEYPVKIANYTFNEKPDSVVCLSDSVADILIACGYSDRITARSDECTQEELKDVPSVGSRSHPNNQKILDAEPDVVFADSNLGNEYKNKLEKSDVNVLTMISAQNNDELKMLYRNISAVVDGDITGRKNGKQRADTLLTTLDDLERLIPDRTVEPTACYIYDITGNAVHNNQFAGKLFDYSKSINICADVSTTNDIADVFKRSNPNYIFCAIGLKEKLTTDDKFKNLDAVKNNKVYEINALDIDRQGSSLQTVLTFMIETMYPEVKTDSKTKSDAVEESSQTVEESKIQADTSLKITEELAFSEGDESDDFKKVQNRLKTLGYFNDNPTGYYGQVSVQAVKNFEKINKLEQDGELSYDDLILLFSDKVKAADYKEESSKPAETSKPSENSETSQSSEVSKQESSKVIEVKADNSLEIAEDMAFGQGEESDNFKKVQQRLKNLGYFNDDVTGYFGEVSAQAVKAFEKANGLDEDGYVSTEDLRLMFSANAKAKS